MSHKTPTSPGEISRILAIRLGGIGDLVLALPALGHLKSACPGSRLVLLTDTRCESVAGLCADIDRVIPLDRRALVREGWSQKARDILDLYRDLRASRFDLAMDLHGLVETNLMSAASGASARIGIRRPDKVYLDACFSLEPWAESPDAHLADTFAGIVSRLTGGECARFPAPTLSVPESLRSWASEQTGSGPLVALYVGASRRKHRWPAEGFAAVALHAASAWDARVVVLPGVAPAEEAIADEIRARTHEDPRISCLKGLGIPELAAVLARSEMLVSNDSGPMHMGSALAVPTIGIFGVSNVNRYAPRGAMDRYVKRSRIRDVAPPDVIRLMEETRASVRGQVIST